MQLLARLMDHVLAKRGRRATIVGATSGDTGGAAIEAFRGSRRVDVVILFPEGRVSDVQRRMMTTPTEANVHAVAVKGTFDDCQALVKGMFNDHAFRDRIALSGVNSINWARIVAQVTYYFAAAAALGAPHRPVIVLCADRQLRRHLRRLGRPSAWGCPIERLVIASNANDILPRALRDRHLRDARRRRDLLAVHGHPDLVQLRALSVRGLGPRRGAGSRQDGRARAERRLRDREHARRPCATISPPPPPARTRSRPPSAGCAPRAAISWIRTPPAACVALEKCLDQSRAPRVILVDGASGQVSRRACRRSPASARRCRRGSPACSPHRSASRPSTTICRRSSAMSRR